VTASAADLSQLPPTRSAVPYTHLQIEVLRRPVESAEYTAGLFRKACQRLGVSPSMGRPGSALDNAVIEAWHSTIEFELRRVEHFATKAAARAKVAAWIPLLRHPGSAGARPCPGRSSSGLTALRRLHLDSACAPAVS